MPVSLGSGYRRIFWRWWSCEVCENQNSAGRIYSTSSNTCSPRIAIIGLMCPTQVRYRGEDVADRQSIIFSFYSFPVFTQLPTQVPIQVFNLIGFISLRYRRTWTENGTFSTFICILCSNWMQPKQHCICIGCAVYPSILKNSAQFLGKTGRTALIKLFSIWLLPRILEVDGYISVP